MTPTQIEAYVDAAAAALALPVSTGHRPGVLVYFALAAGFADVVMAQPLGPHDEPAFVFTPIGPADLERIDVTGIVAPPADAPAGASTRNAASASP